MGERRKAGQNVPGNNGKFFPEDSNGNIIEGTYDTPVGEVRVKKLQKAKHYDVISMARAMNDNFAQRTKELFEPEVEAVKEATESGIYVSLRPNRPPHDDQDCIRVNASGRCFCSHLLKEHTSFTKNRNVPCAKDNCKCKRFMYAPGRPEEFGEFWLRKRRDFDPKAYRMKCSCKHTHEEHECYPSPYRCRAKGCGCSAFNSASVCAACDMHWQDHDTVFETEQERKQAGRQIREDWLPFSELPALRDIAVTGVDNPNVETLADALPPSMRDKLTQSKDRPALPPR
uniref:Protein FAM221B n=2 Tax=Schistocephalus solidus TaxID=70667 RepID=A0A0X3P7W5_SCHSO